MSNFFNAALRSAGMMAVHAKSDIRERTTEVTVPRIIVQAESSRVDNAVTVFQERVSPSDLESGHFGAQLLERLGWAIGDAQEAELERDDASRRTADPPAHSPQRSDRDFVAV
jgi:hypothetical protein